jgi:protoporphyrinogen oxidase
VKKILNNNLVKHHRKAWVYSFDKLIPYPFQAHINYLPAPVFKECLRGFKQAPGNTKPRNFSQWINSQFGQGIARHFMVSYNSKFWQIPLTDLSHQWAKRFVVVPKLKDLTASEPSQSLGYHASFYYPENGGIDSLVNGLVNQAGPIQLNKQAVKINLSEKTVVFSDGAKEKYDVLISTLPLPELGAIITDLPDTIKQSFAKLKWVSVLNVNLGINRELDNNCHWIYFPQKNISFFRVGFFSGFSRSLAPQGKSSLYIDLAYRGKPSAIKSAVSRIKKDLVKTGITKNEDNFCAEQINDIKYAYPIYDKNYSKSRQAIVKFLAKKSIICCGRFGSWEYLSMEDVILQAGNLARGINYEN